MAQYYGNNKIGEKFSPDGIEIAKTYWGNNLVYQNSAPESADIVLQFIESGQTYLTNRWSNPIQITLGDGTVINLTGTTLSFQPNVGDIVRVSGEFRNWKSVSNCFVRGGRCNIITFPPMNKFTTDTEGTILGTNAFRYFFGSSDGNNQSSVISLPAGSFDTSNITTLGDTVFAWFDYYGENLTALPAGSFNFTNITSYGSNPAYLFTQYSHLEQNTSSGVEIYNFKTSGALLLGFWDGTSTQDYAVQPGESFQYYQSS